ncbi:DUF4871 domain-containing protein [Alkalicoccobacillus plakortidis]|uniref:DUF4871 domain-containing protein n=1 Tax=Alkalicoccobacillus plakortidis TaxID=444060 RepID=A0ABT0XG07_9BACI|nr:DUF4871 domain-containing protein [Alkalicoccobacillus plakortidis]MCM2674159.1 DUF4871 domain-containing protein [Alkalicoccobacillus plakortidis]
MNRYFKQTIFLMGVSAFLLAGCSESEWNESEIFESGDFQMLGEENLIGFIYDDSEVTRFYPNKEQKYMWHLWGDDLNGAFNVIATKEGTDEEIEIFQSTSSSGEHNGADASLPSTMSLPETGMWKLDAYVNDSLHGSVFVKVHEEAG